MKFTWIEHHRDEYTVSRLCQVLSVSRSGYGQWRVRAPRASALANQTLAAKVTAIHCDRRRSYGRPRSALGASTAGTEPGLVRTSPMLRRARSGWTLPW